MSSDRVTFVTVAGDPASPCAAFLDLHPGLGPRADPLDDAALDAELRAMTDVHTDLLARRIGERVRGELLEAAREAFAPLGSVAINEPLRGTYIPLRHYGRDDRVAGSASPTSGPTAPRTARQSTASRRRQRR